MTTTPELRPIGSTHTVDFTDEHGKRWRETYTVIGHHDAPRAEITQCIARVALDALGPSERK